MPTADRLPRAGALLLTAALAVALPRPAPAGEAYYLLVFGSQRIPNNPNYAHTFATFVRTAWPGDGPCRDPFTLEARTISWLPCTREVRVNALLPEPGRNWGLDETIRLALRDKERVSRWGPYQIRPELYARALARAAELEGGQVRYKANDVGRRDDRVSNCIHAVSATPRGRGCAWPAPAGARWRATPSCSAWSRG